MDKFELMTEDYLINVLQTQKEEKEKLANVVITVTDHERRISEIERNTPITGTLNSHLSRIRYKRIAEIMGGKHSKAYCYRYPEGSRYKRLSNKVYAEAGGRFKNEFDIATYGELRQHQYDDAVKFWQDYEPSKDTMREINALNRQIVLFG